MRVRFSGRDRDHEMQFAGSFTLQGECEADVRSLSRPLAACGFGMTL
jgi:hypothetical protein